MSLSDEQLISGLRLEPMANGQTFFSISGMFIDPSLLSSNKLPSCMTYCSTVFLKVGTLCCGKRHPFEVVQTSIFNNMLVYINGWCAVGLKRLLGCLKNLTILDFFVDMHHS
jgi:hypothetical protein